MADTRKKNANWRLNVNADNTVSNADAQLAVLMDIRDELQRLNNLLHCRNFQDIPKKLEKIRTNTTKRKYKKKVTL